MAPLHQDELLSGPALAADLLPNGDDFATFTRSKVPSFGDMGAFGGFGEAGAFGGIPSFNESNAFRRAPSFEDADISEELPAEDTQQGFEDGVEAFSSNKWNSDRAGDKASLEALWTSKLGLGDQQRPAKPQSPHARQLAGQFDRKPRPNDLGATPGRRDSSPHVRQLAGQFDLVAGRQDPSQNMPLKERDDGRRNLDAHQLIGEANDRGKMLRGLGGNKGNGTLLRQTGDPRHSHFDRNADTRGRGTPPRSQREAEFGQSNPPCDHVAHSTPPRGDSRHNLNSKLDPRVLLPESCRTRRRHDSPDVGAHRTRENIKIGVVGGELRQDGGHTRQSLEDFDSHFERTKALMEQDTHAALGFRSDKPPPLRMALSFGPKSQYPPVDAITQPQASSSTALVISPTKQSPDGGAGYDLDNIGEGPRSTTPLSPRSDHSSKSERSPADYDFRAGLDPRSRESVEVVARRLIDVPAPGPPAKAHRRRESVDAIAQRLYEGRCKNPRCQREESPSAGSLTPSKRIGSPTPSSQHSTSVDRAADKERQEAFWLRQKQHIKKKEAFVREGLREKNLSEQRYAVEHSVHRKASSSPVQQQRRWSRMHRDGAKRDQAVQKLRVAMAQDEREELAERSVHRKISPTPALREQLVKRLFHKDLADRERRAGERWQSRAREEEEELAEVRMKSVHAQAHVQAALSKEEVQQLCERLYNSRPQHHRDAEGTEVHVPAAVSNEEVQQVTERLYQSGRKQSRGTEGGKAASPQARVQVAPSREEAQRPFDRLRSGRSKQLRSAEGADVVAQDHSPRAGHSGVASLSNASGAPADTLTGEEDALKLSSQLSLRDYFPHGPPSSGTPRTSARSKSPHPCSMGSAPGCSTPPRDTTPHRSKSPRGGGRGGDIRGAAAVANTPASPPASCASAQRRGKVLRSPPASGAATPRHQESATGALTIVERISRGSIATLSTEVIADYIGQEGPHVGPHVWERREDQTDEMTEVLLQRQIHSLGHMIQERQRSMESSRRGPDESRRQHRLIGNSISPAASPHGRSASPGKQQLATSAKGRSSTRPCLIAVRDTGVEKGHQLSGNASSPAVSPRERPHFAAARGNGPEKRQQLSGGTAALVASPRQRSASPGKQLATGAEGRPTRPWRPPARAFAPPGAP
mmetsp:Transcript_67832/g.175798  ORF Transcript_67832/g.175798 Transcript_67832/m.175798 type:complete len:1153 (-) Transcript_67832:69-3527(-)